jgi:hypothetical protein
MSTGGIHMDRDKLHHLQKGRIERGDLEEISPAFAKYFPATTRYYLNNQKLRISYVLDWDKREEFKDAVISAYGTFTPETVRRAVGEAIEKWIQERKK